MVMHLFGDRLKNNVDSFIVNNVVSYENAFSRETTLNLMDSTALIIYDVIISTNWTYVTIVEYAKILRF